MEVPQVLPVAVHRQRSQAPFAVELTNALKQKTDEECHRLSIDSQKRLSAAIRDLIEEEWSATVDIKRVSDREK